MRSVRRVFHAALAALVLACVLAGPALAQDFYLKDGDRVLFYGDSITEQREYTARVEEFVLTRFPAWTLRFVHAGVGGDRVSGGGSGPIDERLTRDVIAFKPTVVTIMLGMNDAGYRPFDQPTFDRYAAGYRHILERLTRELPGVRLTLIQPSPFDDVTRPPTFEDGYNAVLRRYGALVADLAREFGALVVDFNTPVAEGLARVHAVNAQYARQIIPDRVHPEAAGHWLMAEALLRAWRAPARVSRVEIDAAAGRLVAAEGSTVTNVAGSPSAVSWTALDHALPLPQRFDDGTMELVRAAGGRMEELNQQLLVVRGLSPGRYVLTVGGEPIGTRFTAAQLDAGINLAVSDTPMVWGAMPVRWLADEKNTTHQQWLRAMVRSQRDPSLLAAARALEAQEAAVEADLVAARRPVARAFTLAPAP